MSDIDTLRQSVKRSLNQIGAFDLHPRTNASDNRIWYVTHANGRFIAKLPERRGGLTIPVSFEFAILRDAAAVGIAPDPLGHDSVTDVLFIEELRQVTTPAQSEAQTPETIQSVAQTLLRLHKISAPAGLRAYDPLDFARYYCESMPAEKSEFADALVKECEQLVAQAGYLLSGESVCHNDLHVGNLLSADRTVLIDFEYAVRASPVVDIASYGALNRLDDTAMTLLLRSYSEELQLTSPELAAVIRIQQILAELWEIARSDNNAHS